MTSQGLAHGRFQRAIRNRNLLNAEMAAREIGELSLPDGEPAPHSTTGPTRSSSSTAGVLSAEFGE